MRRTDPHTILQGASIFLGLVGLVLGCGETSTEAATAREGVVQAAATVAQVAAAVTGQDAPLADEAADPEGLDPLDEMADLAEAIDRVGRGRAGGAIDRAPAAPEHAAEAVEAGVPVVVARDAEQDPRRDRKITRLNSSHSLTSRMPSSA